MAEMIRNCKENSIEIFKGFHKSKASSVFEYVPIIDTFMEYIQSRNKIVGVKFNNFYERIEIASYFAENEFKKILEKNNFDSVYTGIPFEMGEKSPGFYLNIGNKRPDFLVNFTGIGTVFVDIKCRKLFSDTYNEKEYSFFSITKDEIETINNIEKKVNIPVWLAFKDYFSFDFDKKIFNEPNMYLIPFHLIKNYINLLYKKLGKYGQYFYVFKLPIEILKASDKFAELSINPDFDDEMLNNMSKISIASLTKIKNGILDIIENEEVYKTYLPYILTSKDNKSKYAGVLEKNTPEEIIGILNYLISNKKVIYKKGKFLSLYKKIENEDENK